MSPTKLLIELVAILLLAAPVALAEETAPMPSAEAATGSTEGEPLANAASDVGWPESADPMQAPAGDEWSQAASLDEDSSAQPVPAAIDDSSEAMTGSEPTPPAAMEPASTEPSAREGSKNIRK